MVFSSPAVPGERPSNSSDESVFVRSRRLVAEMAGAGAGAVAAGQEHQQAGENEGC
jgi:hypothetical protein